MLNWFVFTYETVSAYSVHIRLNTIYILDSQALSYTKNRQTHRPTTKNVISGEEWEKFKMWNSI